MQVPTPAMTKTAGTICKNAGMTLPSVRRPSADDLLVLLAVGRSGRYNTAAEELGLNHTTISRRIAALEQSIGGRVLARVGGGWELTDLGPRRVVGRRSRRIGRAFPDRRPRR